ncbi:hypothetical protein NHX12_005926 [Muraenolepis orangiensis]|uniref:Uncharacterized protein n=1 Tax=Muraenolepis orangiensis TaxID=630683 RepID=A0A9Q0IAT0_9TELE|nr:hypothetical protein NHX12_005926 [Muraenolepis orangiensis]
MSKTKSVTLDKRPFCRSADIQTSRMDWEPYRYHVRTIPLYFQHLQSPGTVSVSQTMEITDVHSPDITGVPIGDGDGHGTLATRVLVSGPRRKDMEKVATMDITDVQTMDITGVHSTDITDVPTVHTPDITGVPFGDGMNMAPLPPEPWSQALVARTWRVASKTMDITDVHTLDITGVGDGDGHGTLFTRFLVWVYSVSVRLAHLHIG